MNRRTLVAGAAAFSGGLLAGCAGPRIADFAQERPRLDLRRYFNGTVDAYGMFTDRFGKVRKRFTVVMQCSWMGEAGRELGVLDEEFSYSDGSRQRRIWHLQREPGVSDQGRYRGRADDVVGTAQGEEQGNAFNWTYALLLPVDGRVFEVRFDDWMYLMDERIMLNRARMSKWGLNLGEVLLTFVRRGA